MIEENLDLLTSPPIPSAFENLFSKNETKFQLKTLYHHVAYFLRKNCLEIPKLKYSCELVHDGNSRTDSEELI